ncbi:MAG: hypothetical protein KAS95_04815 [Candidatus Heimdallarchaeota archaeon]|nr:hypothetical protein [Candidatus Heimdallarchaeota archaeon]
MSSGAIVQDIIKEAKNIIVNQSVDEGLKYIESKTLDLEKKENYLESIIVWQFFAESMEKLEEEDLHSYAFSKIITRYLFIENIEKAKEFYDKALKQELDSFHLNTAKTIFERRSKSSTKREIIQIRKRDIFGDFVTILASPNLQFNTVSEIRKYIENQLPKGTFQVEMFNLKTNISEDSEISTEKLDEYEVISITEEVKVE